MTRLMGPRDESWLTGREWESTGSAQAAAPFALPGDRPHYLQDRNVDVDHIKLTVSFDLDKKQVIGKAELRMRPIVDGVQRIELDCEDTRVHSVSVGMTQANFVLDGKKLRIELPWRYSRGRTFLLAIEYVSTPQQGIYFTGPDEGYPDKPIQIWTQGQDTDNHHWFPCIDEPKGRLTSEIVATVPSSWTVISNGRLISDRRNREDGTRTVRWLQDKKHAVYLITLVAGEFSRVVQQEEGPLIDFYCEPGREEDAARAFENTAAMIALYEDDFGEKYPWDKYTQVAVQDFIFGGMENTSATTQTDLTLHDERAHLDFSSDFLVAHEAVHQWFGDQITCREWSHGWLNEGFATYFEARWQEHHRGVDEYLYEILLMARGYLSEGYQRPIVERRYNQPVDIFDHHLYEKGGLVLHMLRRELGDEAFFDSIRHYLKKYKDHNVLTVDLQRSIEDVTGRNMDWFFDQWVFGPGHPQFKVKYSWDDEQSTATLSVRQSQEIAFRCSLDVAFLLEDGRQTFRAKITEKEHSFVYRLDGRPKAVQFDAGYSVVKTVDFTRSQDLLIYQLQNDEDVIGRVDAAQGLGKESSPEAIEALQKAVHEDAFWGVRVAAARALGEIRTDAALDALVSCTDVDHPKARRGVAEALGRFKRPSAAGALTNMLDSDESYYVAATAASSLGKTKSDRAHAKLVSALDRDSHMEVIRASALQGLAELKTEESREVISRWTEYGLPQRARESAVVALGKTGEDHKPTVELLSDLLDDRWYRTRLGAAGALRSLTADAALPALYRMADRELDGRVVRTARQAISAIRAGKNAPDNVNKLRSDLEKLEETNRGLTERLEKLERSLSSKEDGKDGGDGEDNDKTD